MIRFLVGKFWLLCAGLIILCAVLLSIARLLLPYSASYHQEIEGWLSQAIGQPVEIGRLSAEWHGLGPHLLLADVSLIDAASGLPLARFAAAAVEIDLPGSLLNLEPRIDRFVVTGIQLAVERDATGAFTIAGRGLPEIGTEGPASRSEGGRLLPWLLAQGRIALEGAEITWIDTGHGETVERVFTGVNLELRNVPGRHQLAGSASLPAGIGERIAFAVDILGDPPGAAWQARAHVTGTGLDLGALLRGREFGGLRVDQGLADVALWLHWENGGVRQADGRIVGMEIALETMPEVGRPERFVTAVGGDFFWRGDADDWRVDVDRLIIERDGEPRPPAAFALRWRSGDDGAPAISARLEGARIEDATELLQISTLLPAQVRDALKATAPAGTVSAIDFLMTGAGDDRHYDLRAGVTAFRNAAWRGIPGFDHLAGTLVLDNESGYFDIDSGPGYLDFGDLFRAPLPVERLVGRLAWERDGQGWRISSPRVDVRNDDLALTAWGRLDLPADGAMPEIALFAQFTAHTVERTSLYLPTRIMPPATVRWLDEAIRGGAAPRGDLVFHGPLRGFPFDGGSGRFKVDFDVVDGVLAYGDDWPVLEGISANVVFEGRGMSIVASGARSMDSRVTAAEVAIADLTAKPPLLTVAGLAEGRTLDALRYLRESPLVRTFGGIAEDADADGAITLDLRLAIPLDGSRPAVRGELDFSDSTLLLAGETIDITAINGRLQFTETGASASAIGAHILGLPARVNVYPRLADGSAGVHVEATGRSDGAGIAGLLDLALLRHFDGETDWRADLRIPFGETSGAAVASLILQSDLTGIGSGLPAPLAKTRAEALPLRISMLLPRTHGDPVRVRAGDVLTAVFTLDDDNRPERGELRFGGGEPALPEQPGLRITGAVEHYSYDEWLNVFAGDLEDATDGAQAVITGIDLRARRANFFGRDLHEAHIIGRRDAGAWTADVDSVELAGRIIIPHADGVSWRADLERLHLVPGNGDEAGEDSVDPRELPPIRIESRQFSYDGIDFGSLSLVATRRPAGVHLDRLLLSSRQMRVNARGNWVVAGGRQFSSFEIGFDTEDFGAALSLFGYADTIRGGKGTSSVIARWPGPPTAFALERLDGSMDLTISGGRLLEVEPGAGRIFGLISLQALPRRLTLDFSDFFGRGFSFDRINGSFTVKDGVARTTDLTMSGPAAKVEASGEVDLAAREYDQLVTVYPNVTSGLPVAGVVAGGVGLGAAILLMERIFKSDIERMTKITYHVTGPWSEPVIRRLQDGAQSGTR